MTVLADPSPPTVPGSFLLGSALALKNDLLGTYEQARAAHGDVVRFQFGPPGARQEMYGLFHPDTAHHVFAAAPDNFRKDNVFYAEVRSVVADGLLTSQDDRWLRQRRFVAPLFTPRQTEDYAWAMNEALTVLVHRWRHFPDQPVMVHDEMISLSLNVVCRALLGSDAAEILPVVQSTFGPLNEGVLRRTLNPARTPLHWPTPGNRRLLKHRQALHAVCDRIVARRRAHPPDDRHRPDLVTRLMAEGKDGVLLSDAEIREQILIFLVAGFETTGSAMTYALYLLAQHPEVQQQVRTEVLSVVGDRTPSAADAAALKYTTQVVKETLRLYPPAPVIGRRVVEDDDVCGYVLRAGTDLMVSPWVIHRHPEFWPEPSRFDPDRFTAAAEIGRNRYAWMPFGGGARGCIGARFSVLESVLALAVMMREFEFSGAPASLQRESAVTLRPTGGVPMTVTRPPRSA
jgi:cytochrome P450